MKPYHLIIPALLAACPFTFAGQEMSQGKEVKETKTLVEEPLFKDQEFQLGTFAVYSFGNSPTHAGPFRDHAFGDGSEINYFFTRYLGIGAEYSEIYTVESPDTNRGRTGDHTVDRFHVGGNVFFRYPIESLHLAPYIFVGAGAELGDRRWASGHAGLGFEYRFLQHFIQCKLVAERVGFFMDARWTYLGDRYFADDNASRGDLNNFSARAGFRFTY